MALLEHVNLNIPNVDVGREFYVKALGGQENPAGTNAYQLHVNMGASQFHLPFAALPVRGGEPFTVAQVWRGCISLVTSEELDVVKDRVELVAAHVATLLAPNPSSMRATWATGGDSACCDLLVTCPWGNHFRLSKKTIVRATSPARVFGEHAGGSNQLRAMSHALHIVRRGSAAPVGDIFERVLGCSVVMTAMRTSSISGELEREKRAKIDEGELACCTVAFASGQSLIFAEHEDDPSGGGCSPAEKAGASDAYDTSEACAYHLALYLASENAFEEAFFRAHAQGLVYANPRFTGGKPEFSNASTWAEAATAKQFRIKDLGHKGGGEGTGMFTGLVLELEVRAPSHISFPRHKYGSVPLVAAQTKGEATAQDRASPSLDEETIRYYDSHVEEYVANFESCTPNDCTLALFSAAVRRLGGGPRVLDLGCGHGADAAALQAQGFEVDPVDASPAMVAEANARFPRLNARVDTFQPCLSAISASSLDGVWASFSLLHAPPSQFPFLLSLVAKALKPGGALFCGMKLDNSEIAMGGGHESGRSERDRLGRLYSYYSQEKLNALLKAAGFEITSNVRGSDVGMAGIVEPCALIIARRT